MSQTNYLNSYKITFLTKGQEMTYPLSLKYTYLYYKITNTIDEYNI